MVSILLERGQFGAADASRTGTTLLWFALGLPGFSLYLFAQRAFFARHDTKTPFILGLVQNGSNIALAVILGAVFGFSAPVLAAAYALSYTVAAVLIMRRLGIAIDGFGAQARSAWQMLTRVGVAALAMAEKLFITSGVPSRTCLIAADSSLAIAGQSLCMVVSPYLAVCLRIARATAQETGNAATNPTAAASATGFHPGRFMVRTAVTQTPISVVITTAWITIIRRNIADLRWFDFIYMSLI